MEGDKLPTSVLDAVLELCRLAFELETAENDLLVIGKSARGGMAISRVPDPQFDEAVEKVLMMAGHLRRRLGDRDLRGMIDRRSAALPTAATEVGEKVEKVEGSEKPETILDAVVDVCGRVLVLVTLDEQEFERMVQDSTGAYVSRPEDRAKFDQAAGDTLAAGEYLERMIDGRDLRELLIAEAKATLPGVP